MWTKVLRSIIVLEHEIQVSLAPLPEFVPTTRFWHLVLALTILRKCLKHTIFIYKQKKTNKLSQIPLREERAVKYIAGLLSPKQDGANY